MIAGVVQFDRDSWLRAEKTGLDGDLAIVIAELDGDELCDLLADLICEATES